MKELDVNVDVVNVNPSLRSNDTLSLSNSGADADTLTKWRIVRNETVDALFRSGGGSNLGVAPPPNAAAAAAAPAAVLPLDIRNRFMVESITICTQ
jgi:hypothetical protein